MRDISDQCDSLRHMLLPKYVVTHTTLFLLLTHVILMTLQTKLFKSLYIIIISYKLHFRAST